MNLQPFLVRGQVAGGLLVRADDPRPAAFFKQ